jgi:hypothetical protein
MWSQNLLLRSSPVHRCFQVMPAAPRRGMDGRAEEWAMAGIRDVGDVWKNVKEVDLRPIMQSAVQPVRIALVGKPDSGVQVLAARLRTDPYRPAQVTATPLLIAEPPFQQDLSAAEVIIVVISALAPDVVQEQQYAARWQRAGSRVITVVNVDAGAAGEVLPASSFWMSGPFLDGSVNDVAFLEGELVPALLEAMPERGVALARQLPLFRATVARRMIEEVSLQLASRARSRSSISRSMSPIWWC